MSVILTAFTKGEIHGLCDQCGRDIYLRILTRGTPRSLEDIGKNMITTSDKHQHECPVLVDHTEAEQP